MIAGYRALNLSRNKFQCCKLRQYIVKSRPEFYFLEQIFQPASLKFFAWKVEHAVVIRATMLFKLQCNNVARQVEQKCCPYYLALSELICFSIACSSRFRRFCCSVQIAMMAIARKKYYHPTLVIIERLKIKLQYYNV